MGDFVQFSAPTYFGEESAEELTIDVIRCGSLQGVSTVRYDTEDASAKAGVKYHGVSGTLRFQAGEYWKSFKVKLVQDEDWSPTLEFKVWLSEPVGCTIPPDGELARAKIIDDDWFPSNKYRTDLAAGREGVDRINQWGLFVEFVRLNFGQKGIGWRTVVTMLFDQLNNLYLFFLLKARTYMVNVVFSQDSATVSRLIIPPVPYNSELEEREMAAMCVGLMYVLPMVALHVWDYTKVKLDTEGHTRLFLQTSIFRKYLNYSEPSRMKVRASDMQVSIMNHTADLAKAYGALLEMVQMLGKLLLLMIFMLTQDASNAWALVVIPVLMFVFGWSRSRALSQASEFAGPLKKTLIALTTETCAKYRLIADYSQRSQMNDIFESRASHLRRSLILEDQVELNNNYFPRWLGPLFTGGYIAIAARPVLAGQLSLGVFLATLAVFHEVSSDFSSLYKHLMTINTRLDSLKKLVVCYNMATDCNTLRLLCEARKKATRAEFEECLKQRIPSADAGMTKCDMIPIKLLNLTFSYSTAHQWSLRNLSLRTHQGAIVAIVGPPGCGKATLLRLLSQSLLPTEGSVMVPGHLRVLFVAQLPVLFDRSLWENLVFGRPAFTDCDLMKRILKELHMPQTLKLLEPEFARRASTTPVRPRFAKATSRCEAILRGGSPLKGAETLNGRHCYSSLSTEGDDEEDVTENDSEEDEGATLIRACCVAGGDDKEEVFVQNDLSWQNVLSFTEQVKLCLARAIIMNPEVLVLHRPLHNYDNATQKVVLEVLKRHIHNRGLCLPPDEWVYRRPRTLFFTPESAEQARMADVIWQIDQDAGQVYEVGHEDLSLDFVPTKNGEFARKLRSTWAGPAIEGHQRTWKSVKAKGPPSRGASPSAI